MSEVGSRSTTIVDQARARASAIVIDCPCCHTPIVDQALARGVAINEAAALGSERVRLEEQARSLPRGATSEERGAIARQLDELRARLTALHKELAR